MQLISINQSVNFKCKRTKEYWIFNFFTIIIAKFKKKIFYFKHCGFQ